MHLKYSLASRLYDFIFDYYEESLNNKKSRNNIMGAAQITIEVGTNY